jgi:hypothetical protein
MSEEDASVYENMDLELEEKMVNGIHYHVYVLPKGTTIYRGDTVAYLDYTKYGDDLPKLAKPNTFFTLFETEANMYGVPFEYKTTKIMYLLAMDKPDTNGAFYDNAPNDIKPLLKQNYGWETGMRDSDASKDDKVAHYICSVGLDGYASEPMDGSGIRPKLPSEILICGNKNVQFVKIAESTARALQTHIDTYNLRKVAEQTRKGRKSRPETEKEETLPEKGRSLFGSDSDSETTPIKRRPGLFGSDSDSETTPIKRRPGLFGPPTPEKDTPQKGGKRKSKKIKKNLKRKTRRATHK